MRLVTKIARGGTIHNLDGAGTFIAAISEGLQPDPNLPLDDWSEQFMVIPRSTGAAEYGKYKIERTPHAREIMKALSVRHPSRRVVLKASSQMMKTQLALNWFCYIVHQHPSNFLWLMPTGKLHKRIVQRIDRVIESVDVVKSRVSPPGSRLATNSQDIKVFQGGTLFIATAGSAANLSEVPARYVSYDEIDQSELSIDQQGDPVELAENRQTTHGKNAKSYYYSSPTIDGESRIDYLFNIGTKRAAMAQCIHCDAAQELIFENLIMIDDEAVYPCVHCGGINHDSDKKKMFRGGLWTDAEKQSDTESFVINSMFQPYGWYSWTDLHKQYMKALEAQESGQEERMIAFYNTRLARTFKRTTDITTYQALMDRADDYALRTLPHGAIIVTAGVDTQDNRLAVQIVGWGRNLRGFVLDYLELSGDPAEQDVWDQLTELINKGIGNLPIVATAIDVGGHRSEPVKAYVRKRLIPCPIAIHGAIRVNAQPLSRGSMQDVNWKGVNDKRGILLHAVGTIDIKHVLYSRFKNDAERDPDERLMRFSKDLDANYFAGVISETYDRQKKRYINKPGVRNEPLDTLVYAYAALHHSSIRAHRFTDKDWNSREEKNKTLMPAKEKEKATVSKGKISLTSSGGRFG